MFTGERELGQVMVEARAQPIRCCMAGLAILAEAGCRVHRVVGALIFLQVAR